MTKEPDPGPVYGPQRRTYYDEYKKKLCTADEAVNIIKSGDNVYYSGNAATPFPLIEALARRRDELHNVRLNHVLLLGDDPLSTPDMEGHFRHNSLFVGPADRAAVNDGRADYVPVFLHEIPRLFRDGIIPLDVALVQVSPPGPHGYMSHGVETLASVAACKSAKRVVALINDQMPRVLGDCFIRVFDVDHIVECSMPLPELPKKKPTGVEQAIGRYVADLIEDGSTLQLGIGGIPDAVLAQLDDKKNIGVHTEMVSDGVIEAVEKGIVTCASKSIHPGKIVFTFAFGSRHVYEYVHENAMFEAHPVEYTNNPFVISQNEKMVAINSALEVSVTGQVCADTIGNYIYSGFGGQVDFVRGAAMSKGGKPIIALSSTAKGGELSRIRFNLTLGAGVVTSRADVHYVVTEYGVAQLFGKNVRERTQAMINIAHPKFRKDLEREATEYNYL
jgi:4-hydroxybutyrate CoA-transferase